VVDEVTAVDDMNKDGTDVDDLYADDLLQYLDDEDTNPFDFDLFSDFLDNQDAVVPKVAVSAPQDVGPEAVEAVNVTLISEIEMPTVQDAAVPDVQVPPPQDVGPEAGNVNLTSVLAMPIPATMITKLTDIQLVLVKTLVNNCDLDIDHRKWLTSLLIKELDH